MVDELGAKSCEETLGDGIVPAVTLAVHASLHAVHAQLGAAASTVASACPFCMTMLSDGLKAKDREDIRQLDVVELLAESGGAGRAVDAGDRGPAVRAD
jgi:hypothetical protein